MALPISGQLSFNDINVELRNAATSQISLNDTAVRNILLNSSGQLGINSFFAKQYSIWYPGTVTAGTTTPSGPYSQFLRGYSNTLYPTNNVGTVTFQTLPTVGSKTMAVWAGMVYLNGNPSSFSLRLGYTDGSASPPQSLVSTFTVVNNTVPWSATLNSLSYNSAFASGSINFAEWSASVAGGVTISAGDNLNFYIY